MAKDNKTTVTKKAQAKPAARPKKTSSAIPEKKVTKKAPVSKAPVAKKVATKKAPIAQKVVTKKAVAKKPVTKKAVVKKVAPAAPPPRTPLVKSPTTAPAPVPKQTPTPQTGSAVSADERAAMIRKAAYYLAEKRHFAPGFERDDWAEAEREVDAELSRRG